MSMTVVAGRAQKATVSTPLGQRFVWLDPLRWILATFVFPYHSQEGLLGWTQADPGVRELIFRYGYLGVDAFFVISGFAISLSLYRVTAGQFVAHRLKRLLPALIFVGVLEIAMMVLLKVNHRLDQSWWTILTGVFRHLPLYPAENGQFGNFVLWSITIELRFYALALLFLVILALRKRAVTGMAVAIGTAIWLGLIYLQAYTAIPEIEQIPGLKTLVISEWAPYFIFGIVIGLATRKDIPRPFLALMLLLVLPPLAQRIAERLATGQSLGAVGNQLSNAVGAIMIAVFLAYIVIAVRVPNPRSQRLSRALSVLGRASYPLYLIGGFIGMSAVGWLHQDSDARTSTIVTYVVIAIVTVAFTLYVEPRMLAWGKRLR